MSTQLSLLSDNADAGNRDILSVTELTRRIKQQLERGFSSVRLEGEISNFKLHTSGHMYFSLKDSGATISAVVWRSRVPFLSFVPEDGMQVVATGRITVYEIRGNYQLDITSMRPVGEGELQAAFERLKRKLAAEGLFDLDRKKALPEFPERIGIVTSETGAALQDMLRIFERRFPAVKVILLPVKVQGTGAGNEIARAIGDFNKYGHVDLVIIARGGGSLEDLWAFNEEVVARAIAKSSIPIVSAVGHEIDYTIADFVSDLRAPTPSAAAEMVVPDRFALLDTLRNNWYTMHESAANLVQQQRDRIKHLLKSYSFNRPVDILRQFSQRVDELERNIHSAMMYRLSMYHARTESLRHQLNALNPDMVLRRGFVIVRKDGHIVASRRALQAQDEVEMTFHDGTVQSKIM